MSKKMPGERQQGHLGNSGLPPLAGLFEPGKFVATRGALALLAECQRKPAEFLAYHLRGEWGVLDAEDAAANDAALSSGTRIFSAYEVEGKKLWIITEAVGDDGRRARTTLLLPEEY